MPFTGVPGSANAMPGSVVPGLGGATNAINETASNTLVLIQVVQVNVTYNRGVNHTVPLAQSSGQVFDEPASSTLTITQLAVSDLIGNTDLSHTLTLVQSATYTRSYAIAVSQTMMIGQSPLGTQQINRNVSHTLTLTQQALKVIDESVPHTLVFTQTAAVVKVKSQGVVHPIMLSHTVTLVRNYNRTVSQGLVLTQSVTKAIRKVVSASNTLVFTQSAVVVASKLASNTLVLTQDATYVLGKVVRHTLEITQVARENHTVSKRMFDVVPIYHTVALSGMYRKSLISTLMFTQSATAIVVRAAAHTLVLSHEATADKVKPGFSELVLTHMADVNWSLTKPFSNTLFLTHEISLLTSRAMFPGNVLAMEHRAVGTRVITRAVTHNLVLSQEMYRQRFNESVPQTLVLTQTVAAPKHAPRSVSQTLMLTHSVSVAKTLVRSLSHQLVFQNSFTRVIALPGQPTVMVPEVQVVKVRSLVILESGSGVIVLPSPEFNDKEGGNGRINIKRAMDGTRRVYKREQPSSRLMYDFVMDRVKAIELRAFVLAYNSSVIRMTNWKGEIWYVVLTNNPFQFTEDTYWQSSWGNKCSITLEFQGVKIN